MGENLTGNGRSRQRDVPRHVPRGYLALGVLAAGVLALASCAHQTHINLEGPYWKDDDTRAIPEPAEREPSLAWMTVKRTTTDQLLELLDFDRGVRKISGRPAQAKNTNCFDEVPSSSWFTNRHGRPQTRLSPDEIRRGIHLTGGPDTSGVWHVFRPKVGGMTPGFWIEDARGDQYMIKFDPPNNPELATSAAVMGAAYFHACGYYVPQETIVLWHPEMLRIREGATIKEDGKKRPLTMEDIEEILSSVHRRPDGTIRSVASLSIGNVKGPFMFEGTRKDDPNDWCPHEHRRELRGLYVIASLVNHYDIKDHNTKDVYVGSDGSGHLRHFLMDFGSTFGSDGHSVKAPRKGYANLFDLRDAMVSTATLGIKTWAWEYAPPPLYPSVGYFESELFEPHKFDPVYPIPAFEQLTLQDAYWGAKIVMAWSDEDLAALVDAGQLSDPEARAYLLQTLIERRDKIGRHWFGKINPLDYPHVSRADGGFALTFEDLAVRYGLEPAGATYQYEVYVRGRRAIGPVTVSSLVVPLSGDEWARMLPEADTDDYLFEVRVRTKRQGSTFSTPAVFWLYRHPESEEFSVVGIEHPG